MFRKHKKRDFVVCLVNTQTKTTVWPGVWENWATDPAGPATV